jgi:parallel beta-helix repeat protein
VEVIISYQAGIEVFGNLSALGQSDNIIRFISKENYPIPMGISDYWDGIIIKSKGNCELSYCEIQGARKGITISSSNNFVSYCTLKYNEEYAISIKESYNNTISNNEFIGTSILLPHYDKTALLSQIIESNIVNGNPLGYLINKDHFNVSAVSGQFIIIECNNVSIDSLDASNTNIGILIAYSNFITINNCTFNNNIEVGIHIYESNYINMTNCKIKNNIGTFGYATGLRMYNTKYTNVSYCDISGNGYGIVYSDLNGNCIHNTVYHNNIYENKKCGISVSPSIYNQTILNNVLEENGLELATSSHYDAVSSYNIENNLVNGKPLYFIFGKNSYSVPADAGQVILIKCTDILIQDLDVRSVSTGIQIRLSSRVLIKNSLLSENVRGSHISLSSNITFQNCDASYCEYGFQISSGCENISIDNCKIDNTHLGIITYRTNNFIINNCNISTIHEGTGISIQESENITVKYCNLINYRVGIQVSQSHSIEIYNCNISNSWITGIYLSMGSSNTSVYHNNIIGDLGDFASINALDYTGNNSWNNEYPFGGNHWNRYSGQDEYNGENQDQIGSDGIGDIPFDVYKDNSKSKITITDKYPLMKPFVWWDEISPSIELISPFNNSFIIPGETLEFYIWDGNLDLKSAHYSINKGSFEEFDDPYRINTSGNYEEEDLLVRIMAEDNLGNIATELFVFKIDIDTDGDGFTDSRDNDDDNDGFYDEWEEFLGSNPKDPDDHPLDYDGDGIPNGDFNNSQTWMDNDDDGDGVLDVNDPDPLDPNITGKIEIMNQLWLIIIISISLILVISYLYFRKRKKTPTQVEKDTLYDNSSPIDSSNED